MFTDADIDRIRLDFLEKSCSYVKNPISKWQRRRALEVWEDFSDLPLEIKKHFTFLFDGKPDLGWVQKGHDQGPEHKDKKEFWHDSFGLLGIIEKEVPKDIFQIAKPVLFPLRDSMQYIRRAIVDMQNELLYRVFGLSFYDTLTFSLNRCVLYKKDEDHHIAKPHLDKNLITSHVTESYWGLIGGKVPPWPNKDMTREDQMDFVREHLEPIEKPDEDSMLIFVSQRLAVKTDYTYLPFWHGAIDNESHLRRRSAIVYFFSTSKIDLGEREKYERDLFEDYE